MSQTSMSRVAGCLLLYVWGTQPLQVRHTHYGVTVAVGSPMHMRSDNQLAHTGLGANATTDAKTSSIMMNMRPYAA